MGLTLVRPVCYSAFWTDSRNILALITAIQKVADTINMSFFKSLFFEKTVKDNSGEIFAPDFAGQVKKAITLLGNNETSLDDKHVLELFISNGIGYKEANEILLFLPIAFVRHLLPNLKWHDTYNEFINDKKQTERKYGETKSFQIIWDVTKNYFQNSPQTDTILKIGGRSAEFHVINQFLNDGEKLEDIQLTKTMIIR